VSPPTANEQQQQEKQPGKNFLIPFPGRGKSLSQRRHTRKGKLSMQGEGGSFSVRCSYSRDEPPEGIQRRGRLLREVMNRPSGRKENGENPPRGDYGGYTYAPGKKNCPPFPRQKKKTSENCFPALIQKKTEIRAGLPRGREKRGKDGAQKEGKNSHPPRGKVDSSVQKKKKKLGIHFLCRRQRGSGGKNLTGGCEKRNDGFSGEKGTSTLGQTRQ